MFDYRQFSEKKLYVIGAVIFLITAFFSKGYHHFDEHFQILEFASLKLHTATEADMAWEYPTKMRCAFQPTFVFCVHQLFELLGIDNPFTIATLLRFISALLAYASTILLLKTFRNEVSDKRFKTWLIPLSFFLWFGVYNAVRFSSENWSAIFFVSGLCLSLRVPSVFKYFVAGVLLGISFLLRFQMGLMIFGFGLWLLLIRREKISALFSLSVAILLAIGAGVLIDKWFYGEWTLSCWNYFDQNILQDKVSGFGLHPWWWYITEVFVQGIPPFSLVYIVVVFLFFVLKPRHVFTFTLLPFLLIHFFIGHKEVRFLFPLIYFLPLMLVICVETAEANWHFKPEKFASTRFFSRGFWIVNLLLLCVVMFRPADNTINLYEKLYRDYQKPTLLFFKNENPYHRVLDVHWYKRKNLSVTKIESPEQIVSRGDTALLYVTTHRETADALKQPHHLVYSTLPDWLKKFNYNNWLDRTKFWYVYELN